MKPSNNFLKTFRRRVALTQEEIAFLLGSETGASVSRHETGKRVPALDTAIGYALIVGAPVQKLFPARTKAIQRDISGRAQMLLENVDTFEQTVESARKREVLASLAAPDPDEPTYIPV